MSIIGNLKQELAKRHIQIGLIVFLIALLSFGLGYILGRDFTRTPIVIENNGEL